MHHRQFVYGWQLVSPVTLRLCLSCSHSPHPQRPGASHPPPPPLVPPFASQFPCHSAAAGVCMALLKALACIPFGAAARPVAPYCLHNPTSLSLHSPWACPGGWGINFMQRKRGDMQLPYLLTKQADTTGNDPAKTGAVQSSMFSRSFMSTGTSIKRNLLSAFMPTASQPLFCRPCRRQKRPSCSCTGRGTRPPTGGHLSC